MVEEEEIYNYRWMILFIAWMAYIVMYLQRFAIPPLSPFIQEEFALSRTQIGLLMSVNSLGYVAMQIPAGWLADRIGVGKMLLIGEVFAGSMMVGMTFTPSYGVSLVLLGLGGLGCGCLLTSTSKAIMVWFSVKERATAMGVKQTSSNLGGVIGALTLPTLSIALGWRYGFGIIGGAAIIAGIVSYIFYKDHPTERNPSKKSMDKSSDKVSDLLRDVFLSRKILLLGVIGGFYGLIEFSIITYLILYLKETMLITAVLAGTFLAVFEGSGAIGKPLFGLLSDRFFNGSRKKVFFLISTIITVICIIFSLLPPTTTKWCLTLIIIAFGLAANGWSGVLFVFVGETASKNMMGLTIGLATTIGGSGIIFGPLLFGYIVDSTGSYRPAWCCLAICGIISMLLLIPVREQKAKL